MGRWRPVAPVCPGMAVGLTHCKMVSRRFFSASGSACGVAIHAFCPGVKVNPAFVRFVTALVTPWSLICCRLVYVARGPCLKSLESLVGVCFAHGLESQEQLAQARDHGL